MSTGLKANPDGSAAIQVGGTDVITLTSGGAATFVTSPTTVQAGTAAAPSITTSGDTNTGIFFPAADTIAFAEGGAEALRINSSGTVVLSGGDTSANGTGITFPATQSASSNANTLDDYEEGVFEPIALGSNTAGTGTYTLQAGRYTKIGRVCFFQFTIGWSNITGAAGDLNLGGLPFTSLGQDGELVAGQSTATIGYLNGLSFTNPPRLYIPLSNTILVLTQTTTGGVLSGVPIDTAVTEIIVSGHYIVA
jgi:hypothetical protein